MERIRKYEPLWGEWKVTGKIGEGSFGAVYEVERTLWGNTSHSAVKLISFNNVEMLKGVKVDETISAEELEAVKREAARKSVREAALMDKLQGRSNIVTIYDYAIYPNEKTTDIIIRMERLTNLWDYIKTVKVDTDLVIKLGQDICRALESCEKEKIIHRDIKPDNIFINKDGDFKLGDFGLSRQMNKSASMSLRKSKGTPLYMPPEAFMWGHHVNETSDIYSLGIVMYQLLNDGNIPFGTRKGDFEDEDNAIGRRLDGEEITPPRHGEEGLWVIIKKACQHQKEERYHSAEEMRKELADLKNKLDAEKKSETNGADIGKKKNKSSSQFSFSVKNILKKAQEAWDVNQFEQAFQLFQQAARLGNAEAENALGYCYYIGYGTITDYEKAFYWFKKAAEQGNEDAKIAMEMLEQQMEKNRHEKTKSRKSSKESNRYHIGDIITFGFFRQQPIEWIVLKTEERKMLIISKHILERRAYHDKLTPVTWETSDIRHWLNGNFYETAFNAEEKKKIQKTVVKATKNPKYNTNPGNDTEDRIFLLSIDEAESLFSSDKERQCKLAWSEDSTETAIWWLRSPGSDTYIAADVYFSGYIYNYGMNVYSDYGVRPVMWIEMGDKRS